MPSLSGLVPCRFALVRQVDHSGVSGVGIVAYGVQWPDGAVAVRWNSDHASTVVWDSIDDAMAVHGHGGDTQVVWYDDAHEIEHRDLAQPLTTWWPQ